MLSADLAGLLPQPRRASNGSTQPLILIDEFGSDAEVVVRELCASGHDVHQTKDAGSLIDKLLTLSFLPDAILIDASSVTNSGALTGPPSWRGVFPTFSTSHGGMLGSS